MEVYEKLKLCRDCKEEKPLADFSPDSRTKDGRQGRCKRCRVVLEAEGRREYRKKHPRQFAEYSRRHREKVGREAVLFRERMKKHGITAEQYDAMFLRQDGKCAICAVEMWNAYNRLSIDHDHQTGRVRGLLCRKCNAGIGCLGDDIELLAAAIAYLSVA